MPFRCSPRSPPVTAAAAAPSWEPQVRDALTDMGPSVLMASITTFGSATLLFFSALTGATLVARPEGGAAAHRALRQL